MIKDRRSLTLVQTVRLHVCDLVGLLYLSDDSLIHIFEPRRQILLHVGDIIREEAPSISRIDTVGHHAGEEGVVHVCVDPLTTAVLSRRSGHELALLRTAPP